MTRIFRIDSLVPVRFYPDTYIVTEGVSSTTVITLEALVDHAFDFTVTVVSRDGSEIREYTWVSHTLLEACIIISITYQVQLYVIG